MKNVIPIEQLLESKVYVRNGVRFPTAKELVEPFLDSINADEGSVVVEYQNEVINEEVDGEKNIAYPRFKVEFKKEFIEINNIVHENIVGLLIAMDQQNPVAKVYTGLNVKACLNLTIFNAEHVFAQNLNSSSLKIYDIAKEYEQSSDRLSREYEDFERRLMNTNVSDKEVSFVLGSLLRKAKAIKLGTAPVVKAAQLLDDTSSLYYFEKETTLWNVYNAVTQSIGDLKDILYKPDKTVATSQFFLNLN